MRKLLVIEIPQPDSREATTAVCNICERATDALKDLAWPVQIETRWEEDKDDGLFWGRLLADR